MLLQQPQLRQYEQEYQSVLATAAGLYDVWYENHTQPQRFDTILHNTLLNTTTSPYCRRLLARDIQTLLGQVARLSPVFTLKDEPHHPFDASVTLLDIQTFYKLELTLLLLRYRDVSTTLVQQLLADELAFYGGGRMMFSAVTKRHPEPAQFLREFLALFGVESDTDTLALLEKEILRTEIDARRVRQLLDDLIEVPQDADQTRALWLYALNDYLYWYMRSNQTVRYAHLERLLLLNTLPLRVALAKVVQPISAEQLVVIIQQWLYPTTGIKASEIITIPDEDDDVDVAGMEEEKNMGRRVQCVYCQTRRTSCAALASCASCSSTRL
jgi:hypothetical protein